MKSLRSFVAVLAALAMILAACDSKSGDEEESADRPEASSAEEGGDDEESKSPTMDQSDIEEDQSRTGATEGEHFYVKVLPQPNPIPFQKLFELEVEVFEDEAREEPAEGVSLDQVRAEMPAHNHGMNVDPTIEEKGDGRFLVEGMRFHMQGDGEDGHWVLELVLSQDDLVDQAKFDLQCCRE